MSRLARSWLAVLVGMAAPVRADPEFIPIPLPPPTSSVPPAAMPDRAYEIERAVRGARQRREERGLEHDGSHFALEHYRLREQRALDAAALQQEIDRARGLGPASDAQRVRSDIDRAREQLELERRLDRIEPTRP